MMETCCLAMAWRIEKIVLCNSTSCCSVAPHCTNVQLDLHFSKDFSDSEFSMPAIEGEFVLHKLRCT